MKETNRAPWAGGGSHHIEFPLKNNTIYCGFLGCLIDLPMQGFTLSRRSHKQSGRFWNCPTEIVIVSGTALAVSGGLNLSPRALRSIPWSYGGHHMGLPGVRMKCLLPSAA